MLLTVEALRSVAASGGSIILAAGNFTTDALRSIANSLSDAATLTIKGVSRFSVESLRSIASANPGKVIFDFSE